MKIRFKYSYCGIIADRRFGPVFGVGPEILISDKANQNTRSSSTFGETFESVEKKSDDFLAGSKLFSVRDIEVFKLKPSALTDFNLGIIESGFFDGDGDGGDGGDGGGD